MQIYVGDSTGTSNGLHFQNDTYVVDILENTPSGREVVQVKAIPPHGHSSAITYSIKSGNEENAVDIDPRTGTSFFFFFQFHMHSAIKICIKLYNYIHIIIFRAHIVLQYH